MTTGDRRRARIAVIVFAGALLIGCRQQPIAGPIVLEATDTVLHQVGHFDPEAKTLVAKAGEKGMLAYGPYADLTPGHYEVTFIVSSGNAAGPIGTVDVNAFTVDKQSNVLASMLIPPAANNEPLTMQFDVPAGVKLEFRVFDEGNTSLALHETRIRKR